MAGVKSTSIETLFEGVPVVRTMPNTPMMFSQGMVALAAGAHAGEDHLDAVESFFSPVAKTLRVDEKQMDGVTAVSGSGPAYVFRLAEEVLEQSSKLGLGREQALTLWAQTLRGAASMLEGETSPKELREQVTSPGGTTQAALETFETLGLASAFGAGLKAAYDRSIELS
jgi:pyrroline-5-carboxylate reductase